MPKSAKAKGTAKNKASKAPSARKRSRPGLTRSFVDKLESMTAALGERITLYSAILERFGYYCPRILLCTRNEAGTWATGSPISPRYDVQKRNKTEILKLLTEYARQSGEDALCMLVAQLSMKDGEPPVSVCLCADAQGQAAFATATKREFDWRAPDSLAVDELLDSAFEGWEDPPFDATTFLMQKLAAQDKSAEGQALKELREKLPESTLDNLLRELLTAAATVELTELHKLLRGFDQALMVQVEVHKRLTADALATQEDAFNSKLKALNKKLETSETLAAGCRERTRRLEAELKEVRKAMTRKEEPRPEAPPDLGTALDQLFGDEAPSN